MTTITLKINEKTKKRKAFLALAKVFYDEKNEVELVLDEENHFNPEFVAKILKASKKKGRTMVNAKDLWESIK